MKDVLSVVAVFMGALCFAVFLIALKPDAHIPVTAPVKPSLCKGPAPGAPGCWNGTEYTER